MIGLVWNSMMSMAGGWFFLTVTEAFTLRDHDYRLPGIGSYMNEAMLADNVPAMIADVIAMVLMIVFADQVVWRPLVAWSQRLQGGRRGRHGGAPVVGARPGPAVDRPAKTARPSSRVGPVDGDPL